MLPAASNTGGMPWPAGIYTLTFLNIEEDDRPPMFGTTPRCKLTFQVDKVIRLTPQKTADLNNQARQMAQAALNDALPMVAWCNLTMARNSTLRNWIEAMLGRTIGDGEVVNPAEAAGRQAEGTVEWYEGADKTQKLKLATLTPIAQDVPINF
jgi:hypothetical protein